MKRGPLRILYTALRELFSNLTKGPLSSLVVLGETVMDLVYVGLMLAFALILYGFVWGCHVLEARP